MAFQSWSTDMPTAGSSMTCSRITVAESTASAIAMLKAQGAIILGRTATAERTVNGAYAKDQHPGFESPGSCVAAGLGLAAACLGSKQKSIKNYYTTMGAPCVRIKPTVGLISAQGMINIERSGNDEQLSPVPIARSVEDAALLLSVLSGRHDYVPRQLDFTGTQVVIANRERNRDNTAEKQFRNMFATICAKLKDSGANIVEADDLLFPHGASMAHSPQLVEIQTANQDPMSAAGEGPSSNKSANTALDTQIEATLKRWQCDAILVPEGSFHGFFLSEPCDLSQTPVIHLPLGFYSNPETPTDKGDTRSDGYPRKVISAHHVP
ncbi:amidase signature domain-containing protein [Bombardia bombarda]|uniref:Amidase signature domain-containing protein n=1 Tax=Bombardia bombarda TaxID=252184 RepID=A0AA39X0T9_9PEZI|nr:amidase signature domain-containing protein [Bombardia bombarda]